MRAFMLSMVMVLSVSLPAQAIDAAKPKPNLTILADESMLLPLAQVARSYARETQTPLTVVLKNTQTVQKQIEQGLEAHLVITANYPLIDQLTEQGLTDVQSRRPLARTQLALVTASTLDQQAALAKHISFASILAATPGLPLYINDASTMEGSRAATIVADKALAATLVDRIVVKPTHDELIGALHDGPSLGLILAAEAVDEPDIRVISLLPDELSPPVIYDVVVLGSELMGESKAFANYLASRKTRAVFSQFGYQPPPVR